MTETPAPPAPAAHADSPIVQAVAPGYAFEETSLELGGLMLDAETLTDTHIRIPLAMLNRHGLVAGATGTGKTKTLQLLAEQLSAHGVPVFAADVKGDLSGLATPGESNEKLTARTAVGRADLDGHGVPGRVLRARRPGHRHPAPGHHVVVRPDPPVARCSASTRPRSRAWGWSSTTPTRPASRCWTSPTCGPW